MAALGDLVCVGATACAETSATLGVAVGEANEPVFTPSSGNSNTGDLKTIDGADDKDIAIAVALSVGGVLLLCCACALARRVQRKRKERYGEKEPKATEPEERSEFSVRVEALNPGRLTHAGPLPRSKSLPRSGPNTFEDAEDAVPLPARSVSFSSNTSDTSDSSNTSNASDKLRRQWLGQKRGELITDPDELCSEIPRNGSMPHDPDGMDDLSATSAADCKASLSFKARAPAKSGANSGSTTPPIAGTPLAPPLAAAQEWLAGKVAAKENPSPIRAAQDWLEDTESDTAFSDRAVEAAETRAQALTNNGGSSSSAAGPPAANSPPKIPSYAPSSTSTGPELDAHKPASHSVNRY